jgi:hypothetical protein
MDKLVLNKLISRTFLGMLLFMVTMVMIMGGMGSGPAPTQAELAKEKRVMFSGTNLATATGNATGALTGVNVAEKWGYPDELTCYSYVTNASGVATTNTATWALEASYDNSFYNAITNTTVSASEVDLITNATYGTGKYYRVNVQAIQNANAYLTVQCIFQ